MKEIEKVIRAFEKDIKECGGHSDLVEKYEYAIAALRTVKDIEDFQKGLKSMGNPLDGIMSANEVMDKFNSYLQEGK